MINTCVSCGLEQESDLFPLNGSGGKRSKRCKPCKQKYDRDWYLANREASNERRKKTRPAVKLRNHKFIISYLEEHPCKVCGETDTVVLEFDHREPEEKSHNISIMMQHCSLESLKKEIEKCDVLCANCHRRRTAKQFGWYAYARE